MRGLNSTLEDYAPAEGSSLFLVKMQKGTDGHTSK